MTKKEERYAIALVIIFLTIIVILNAILVSQGMVLVSSNHSVYAQPIKSKDTNNNTNTIVPYIGVNMRGYNTTVSQARGEYSISLPDNYFETSFKKLSDAGMNHVRYRFYWESYERDPLSFINEIKSVAKAADKYDIKVLYDNHQYDTSSWLNPKRGTGFPFLLFEGNNSTYPYGSGGDTDSSSAKSWWTNWWNRSIKANDGSDGWVLQARFLQEVVKAVDKHTSTLGYEILNQPQIHNIDQWTKVSKYNSFMTNALRQHTEKTISYDMNIPLSLRSPIEVSPVNLAKMAPSNKTNVIFKISVYGIPAHDSYQADRLNLLINASRLAGVPLYIGEWNSVSRGSITNSSTEAIPFGMLVQLGLNQTEADAIVKRFKEMGVWGMAYWNWSFFFSTIPNYNLIRITDDGSFYTTKHFDVVKNAYSYS